MASVKGDMHEIGKNIAITMFNANGYEILDLGADVELATDNSLVLVYENSRWRAWSKPPAGAASPITGYAVILADVANTTSIVDDIIHDIGIMQ